MTHPRNMALQIAARLATLGETLGGEAARTVYEIRSDVVDLVERLPAIKAPAPPEPVRPRSDLAAPVTVFTCPDCGSDRFVFRHRIHIVNGYHVPQLAGGVPVCECGWTDHRERPIYPGDIITGADTPRPVPTGDDDARP